MFLRVSVRYGGGKLGRVGQNENVIVMVKSNHGITTEVIPLMVKEWDGEDIHSDSGRHLN